MVIWLSGNRLVVLASVTFPGSICVRLILAFNHSPKSTQPGHPFLGIGGKGISKRWGVNRHAARYASPVSSYKLMSGWEL